MKNKTKNTNLQKNNKSLNIGSFNEKTLLYPLETLKKHFVALGASGSGKTVICKTIIEEAAMHNISSIIIDPQGDLASLSLLDENAPEEIKNKFKKINITIFTPTSSKGVPICINPLKLPSKNLEYEDFVSILNQISNAICELIGLDIDKDDGKSAQATFFLTLKYCYNNNLELSNFNELIELIKNIPNEIKEEVSHFITSKSDMDKLIKKLKFLTIGEKELLFQYGVPLDIDILLGKTKKTSNNNNAQISIIYLNTLESQDDKEFFVAMLSTKLYEWMLVNPSKDLQALFYIDEISSYLPAGAIKPVSKPILTLIYKQARKYGVGCLMSTQNPGDVDYKAFAQVGTWAVGRLTTEQDRDKIKDAITTISKQTSKENITKLLPTLEAGNFIFFCPDIAKETFKLKVRKLYTKHITLTEKEVKDITNNDLRKSYEQYFVKTKTLLNISNTNSFSDSESKKTESKNIFLKKNIDEKTAKQLIKKQISRGTFSFFSSNQTILDIKLNYEPVILFTIKKSEHGLFKKIVKEYKIFTDINLHSIYDVQNNKKYTGMAELLNLNKQSVDVIKEILNLQEVTKEKMINKFGFENKELNVILNTLKNKKLISFETHKNVSVFSLLFDITIPTTLNTITQRKIEIETSDIEKINTLIIDIQVDDKTVEKLSDAINYWFGNCAITDYKIAYCPIYEIKISDNSSKIKTTFLNAYTGKISKTTNL